MEEPSLLVIIIIIQEVFAGMHLGFGFWLENGDQGKKAIETHECQVGEEEDHANEGRLDVHRVNNSGNLRHLAKISCRVVAERHVDCARKLLIVVKVKLVSKSGVLGSKRENLHVQRQHHEHDHPRPH